MTTIAYGGGLEGGRKVVQEANGQAGERFRVRAAGVGGAGPAQSVRREPIGDAVCQRQPSAAIQVNPSLRT